MPIGSTSVRLWHIVIARLADHVGRAERLSVCVNRFCNGFFFATFIANYRRVIRFVCLYFMQIFADCVAVAVCWVHCLVPFVSGGYVVRPAAI